MDKITVTQDDVEAAKDEGATFVLKKLAEMVGVSDWSIQDGSESWEGDVSATAYHILVQAKVINDWDNSVARHQTDAQMAAPDALAAEFTAVIEQFNNMLAMRESCDTCTTWSGRTQDIGSHMADSRDTLRKAAKFLKALGGSNAD